MNKTAFLTELKIRHSIVSKHFNHVPCEPQCISQSNVVIVPIGHSENALVGAQVGAWAEPAPGQHLGRTRLGIRGQGRGRTSKCH